MIRFRYQPTFKDWLALNRIVSFRFLLGGICVSLVLLILFLGYPFALRLAGHHEITFMQAYRQGAGLLLLPGFVGLMLLFIYRAIRKRWNSAEELREAREYVIDDAGVRITAATFSGFLEWRLLTQAELKQGYFLLRTGQNQFHYFPASIVPDQQALIDLLARKVPKKQTRPRGCGSSH